MELLIAAAMRQVNQQSGAGKIQGEVGLFDCRNALSGQTGCLSEVAKRHQTVRQQQCDKRAARRAAKADITLEEFAEDEIAAYQAERKYILTLLNGLTLCKPRGWFGTVTYSVTKRYVSEHKSTYGLKKENSQESATDTTTVANGVLRLSEVTADQSESVTYTTETSSLEMLQLQCHTQKGYITQTDTLKTKVTGGDQGTKTLTLKVIETPNLVTLSFSSLSYTVPTSGNSLYHSTGCKEKTEPKTFSGTTTVTGVGFKLGDQLSSDGLTFRGNQKNKLRGLIAGDIKVNESDLTAVWTLHRLTR